MADFGRLDELQRKFDENPRRYFAPLANAYRKSGALEQAIEICQTFLPQQPAHMSGYVVLGQALFDAGRGGEAVGVFHKALELDPENLVALWYLGDIARMAGDRHAALGWYRKVIELDPKNVEVAAHLTELSAAVTRESSPGPAHSVVEPAPEPVPEPASGSAQATPPDLHRTEVAEEQSVVSEGENSYGSGDSYSPAHVLALLPPVEPEEEGEKIPPITDFLVAAAQTTGPEPSGLMASIVELPQEFPDVDGQERQERPEQRGPQEHQRAQRPGMEPVTEPVAPFVTETMAELYLRQGFKTEALAVYRRLAEERGEARLLDLVQQLEYELLPAPQEPSTRDAAGQEPLQRVTVREFFARIGTRRPAAAATPPSAPHSLSVLFGPLHLDPADTRAATALAAAFGVP